MPNTVEVLPALDQKKAELAALVESTEFAGAPFLAHPVILWLAIAGLSLLFSNGCEAGLHSSSDQSHQTDAAEPSGPEFRFVLGNRTSYKDGAGREWTPAASNCSGGQVFEDTHSVILGTSDPDLFTIGRIGPFDCKIPLPPGLYEVHSLTLDRHHATASETVEIGVQRQGDGSVHLHFGPGASVSGIMLVPGIPGHMRPLRLTAAPTAYTDLQGRLWLPDSYAFGGGSTSRMFPTAGAAEPGLFAWEHFGRTRYVLPAASGDRYRLTLYFSEGYFGPGKRANGGVGSRIFNVVCNGRVLLNNFDIFSNSRPGHQDVVEVFDAIQPNPQGQIELEFNPVRDYPLINAIELAPESHT